MDEELMLLSYSVGGFSNETRITPYQEGAGIKANYVCDNIVDWLIGCGYQPRNIAEAMARKIHSLDCVEELSITMTEWTVATEEQSDDTDALQKLRQAILNGEL